jgi:uncharacterized protein (DUF983 family)
LNRAVRTDDDASGQEQRSEPDTNPKSAWLLLSRGIRLRCPNCGTRGILDGYFGRKERCPRCGILLERGEGDYFMGAYALNLVAVEAILAAVFVIVMLVTWPNPPWDALEYGGASLAVLAPIACYPFAKAVWGAIDLIFRPPGREDFISRTK